MIKNNMIKNNMIKNNMIKIFKKRMKKNDTGWMNDWLVTELDAKQLQYVGKFGWAVE